MNTDTQAAAAEIVTAAHEALAAAMNKSQAAAIELRLTKIAKEVGAATELRVQTWPAFRDPRSVFVVVRRPETVNGPNGQYEVMREIAGGNFYVGARGKVS